MYGREVDGEVLEFGHAGLLYRDSFVMYDRRTQSLWLHVTGEALKGPLRGKRLEFLPSEVVPWSDWRTRHPDGGVLVGERAGEFMGSFSLRDRIREYGLSVGQGREVALYRYSLLERREVLNDSFDGKPLVLVFDPRTTFAAAYVAELDGEPVLFEPLAGRTLEMAGSGMARTPLSRYMRDVGSGSLWDRTLGECVAGARVGRRLERIPATPWLVNRWLGFFPEGRDVGSAE